MGAGTSVLAPIIFIKASYLLLSNTLFYFKAASIIFAFSRFLLI